MNVRVKEFIVLLIFGLLGQVGCWVSMMSSQAVTTLDNALIIHAISAPIIFAIVSLIYFTKYNYTTPQTTAVTFVSIVILMDFFVVALLINQSFDMFLSPIGTWIPFTLIVISTYLTGFFVYARRTNPTILTQHAHG